MERLHSAGRYASLHAREPRQRLSYPPASWDEFRDLFHPMARHDGSFLWSRSDIPSRLGSRHVWTVTERDGSCYLAAGRCLVDVRGYVLTAVAWPGLQDHVPIYACPLSLTPLYPAPTLGALAGAP